MVLAKPSFVMMLDLNTPFCVTRLTSIDRVDASGSQGALILHTLHYGLSSGKMVERGLPRKKNFFLFCA